MALGVLIRDFFASSGVAGLAALGPDWWRPLVMLAVGGAVDLSRDRQGVRTVAADPDRVRGDPGQPAP